MLPTIHNTWGNLYLKFTLTLYWSTKNRFPLINKEIKPRLHSYMAGTLHQLDSPATEINSMPDHVHVFFRLSKNFSLAKVVEEVKKSTSKWAKAQGVQNFFWQTGYGAFSVSSSKTEVVKIYIRNHQIHHKKMTFQKEVVDFMKKYSMGDFNDEYFWR